MINYMLEKMGFDLFADLEGLKRDQDADSRLLAFFQAEILPEVKNKIYFSDDFRILRQLLSIAIFAKRYEELMGEPLRAFYEKHPIPVYTSKQFEADLVSIKKDYANMYRSGIWECTRNVYDPEQQSFVSKLFVSGRIDFSRISEVVQVVGHSPALTIPNQSAEDADK